MDNGQTHLITQNDQTHFKNPAALAARLLKFF